MATTEKCIEMSNRLRSIKNSENPEVNHIIAGADDIYDDVLEKKQSELNEFIQATKEAVDELSPDQTEALALATDVVQLKEDVSQGAVYDVSAKHPTAGPNSDGKFANLDYVLSNADTLIPSGVRKGGMSIKFITTSDNKYVQYRLMATSFSTNESNWQGVDDEPTAESENLVKSGGVYEAIKSEMPLVDEDGFHVVDEDYNIGMKYDEDGLDAAKVSSHFVEIIKAAGVNVDIPLANYSSEVVEDGFFFVDRNLNVGVMVDSDGIHAKNLLEYEIIEN